MNPYSLTSNDAKVLKHPEWLASLQAGICRPVLLCVAPTNRCQLACRHCCFRDRDRELELPFPALERALVGLAALGLESVELTGGGEPTLYPHLARTLALCRELSLPVGLNTNGLALEAVAWRELAWVRLNANVLDNPRLAERWCEHLAAIERTGAAVSACYIVGRETSTEALERAIDVCVAREVPLRLAPDCQHRAETIREHLGLARGVLEWMAARHGPRVREVAFVSDFNTPLGPRASEACYAHLMKPLLWPDGWLYACPSAELALEVGSDVAEPFRLCRAEDAEDYYEGLEPEPRRHACSFCKYESQNRLVEAALAPTDFNTFI